MAKFVNDIVMDDGLNNLKAGVNRVAIATAAIVAYADVATNAVGTCVKATGDFTVANGDGGGRKVTCTAATIVVGTAGNVTHVAYYGTTGSGTVWAVATCAPTAVSVSGTAIVAQLDITEIGDVA